VATHSAGILLHRSRQERIEVLLVHPGGPFWARRDEGAWSIPKGEFDPADEDALSAARREFAEELGTAPPSGPALDLGQVRQRSGKHVHAFAVAGDLDPDGITSNTCEVVWPPRSGRTITVPEVDRAAWVTLEEAHAKLLEAQRPLLERLREALA
jgi:predicted NUDIX family NTP pyrophosphohydrolase